ncbi:MAG: NAD(P)/FAD-dependent oxidoreductase [Myxococcales bacterium]|nr:NAD(P)/FAD-dependent oxidoreductase [Myxococcales bacterium]
MTTTPDPIDHEALRTKYLEERDKRLRPDGNDQYIEPSGRYAHFLDDPYVTPKEREPLTDEVTVALIGGGFSGLTAGARLKEAGVEDVRIVEGGGDVGGVWYWNRYPGAMCDTAAMIYLPLLEETGYMPSKKYTFAPEIFGHAKRIAEQYKLYDKALFSTQVTKLEWDAASSRWIVHTDRGDAFRAQFVAMGTGPLNRPKLPGIEGIESFEGHAFHTSRWDYDYTGGDPNGALMEKLADKRVAIIGTGATAVQCIGPLAKAAKALYVFQRTPSSVDVRNNHEIDPEWFKTLGPGWQKEWLENFATLQTGGMANEDLVKDGWTDIAQRIRGRMIERWKQAGGAQIDADFLRRAFEECDDEKMTEIRARVESIVEDKATAEALKPWYRQLCKRPCFHDEYLQAYNEPGTHLIDTDGKGVQRMDKTGIWVGDTHYEVDCIIFASGFSFGSDQIRGTGFTTVGRDGLDLGDRWAEGMQTLHGMHVHGFPNLFVIGPNQGAFLISNITHNLTEAGTTIASVVAHARKEGAQEVEVTPEAEQAWVSQFQGNRPGFLGNPDCTPGYYNNEGAPIGPRERLNAAGYPKGPVAFFKYLEAWRDSGDFEGLEFR